jgi:hypothetical protein
MYCPFVTGLPVVIDGKLSRRKRMTYACKFTISYLYVETASSSLAIFLSSYIDYNTQFAPWIETQTNMMNEQQVYWSQDLFTMFKIAVK